MDKEILKTGGEALFLLIICFAVHRGIFLIADYGESLHRLGYSLSGLYGFEFIFTVILFLSIAGVRSVLPNSLGFLFLILITLRLAGSYLFVRSGLDSPQGDEAFKYNFLIVVLVFLGTDTYLVYRILNKKVTG